jgi:hypothetical protein
MGQGLTAPRDLVYKGYNEGNWSRWLWIAEKKVLKTQELLEQAPRALTIPGMSMENGNDKTSR